LQIRVSLLDRKDEVECVVQDNGIGIDEPYFATIFGLFNRLDATSTGTGMGLALVKRIVEFHGGRVWVRSSTSEDENQGSRFHFTLSKKLCDES
jgi:signal transduction histidine kinase